MENRKIPALIALAGVVIAVVVFLFVANDDTADQETETTTPAETHATEPADAPDDSEGGDKKKPKPEKPEEPAVPELEIRGGAPVGGPLEVEVTEGEELRIDVTTDAPDELHLHSYDVYLDIEPGKTNELVVENADIGGVIELESHSTGALLAEISVVPG